MKWLLCLYMTFAFAQDYSLNLEKNKAVPNFAAQVLLVEGSANRVNAGIAYRLKIGDKIQANDKILTRENSQLKLELVDATILDLGSSTEIDLTQFDFRDKNDRDFILSISKGQIRAHYRNKALKGQLLVKTRAAQLEVKGTELLINQQSSDLKDISEFVLLSGEAKLIDSKSSLHQLATDTIHIEVREQNTGNSFRETINLNSKQKKYYGAHHMDEKNQFKPFYPFFKKDNLLKESPLYATFFPDTIVKKDDMPIEEATGQTSDESEEWMQKLNQLNKKLKENQF